MRSCFTFRFFEPDENKRSSLVIFFSSEISLDSAAKALKNNVEESLVPKNVYMLTMESFSSTLHNVGKMIRLKMNLILTLVIFQKGWYLFMLLLMGNS